MLTGTPRSWRIRFPIQRTTVTRLAKSMGRPYIGDRGRWQAGRAAGKTGPGDRHYQSDRHGSGNERQRPISPLAPVQRLESPIIRTATSLGQHASITTDFGSWRRQRSCRWRSTELLRMSCPPCSTRSPSSAGWPSSARAVRNRHRQRRHQFKLQAHNLPTRPARPIRSMLRSKTQGQR